MRILWVICIGLLCAGSSSAKVELPSIFSDHAVLQAGKKVAVWGWAEPGEKITVKIGDTSVSSIAAKNRKWQTEVGPFEAGAKLTMAVQGSNKLTVKDILVGEVWLCSGQSNMAMTVRRSKDVEKEKADADYPQIRMFITARSPRPEPQDRVGGRWIICNAKTVDGFSAAAYFFGKKLHKELKVPVGLINSSVGGTAVESWTSLDVQKDDPKLKPIFTMWNQRDNAFNEAAAKARYEKQLATWKERAAKARKEGKRPPRRPRVPVKPTLDRNYPSNLFNGMIHPLIPYGIRGTIWYQGEHNARTEETASRYAHQLPLLIQDWRQRFQQEDFPFYWAQLPNFKPRSNDPGKPSAWAVMRESMTTALKTPNTGMAITIDVGEAKDIHPKNKQAVGRRLAMAALSQTYKKSLAASGPLYKSHEVNGSKVVVTFSHTYGGLKVQGDALKGFAIAGKDGKWQWAEAKVDGEKVIVWHDDISNPQMVRYAWGDNPEATLYNKAQLPAGPFRTEK